MNWGEGVVEALQKVAQRSDDGWVVVLVSFRLSQYTCSSYSYHQFKGNPLFKPWVNSPSQVRGLYTFSTYLQTSGKVSLLCLLFPPYSPIDS